MVEGIQALLERLREAADAGDKIAANTIRIAREAGVETGVTEGKTVKWEESHTIREAADRIEVLGSALAAAERERDAMAEALRKVAYLRPAGVCKNNAILAMERIALDALDHRAATHG